MAPSQNFWLEHMAGALRSSTASRASGRRSRGPKTPEGKARSAGIVSAQSGTLAGARRRDISAKSALTARSGMSTETVDAGTRVLRFMLQDLIGSVVPAFKETKSWANNLIGSAVAVAAQPVSP